MNYNYCEDITFTKFESGRITAISLTTDISLRRNETQTDFPFFIVGWVLCKIVLFN